MNEKMATVFKLCFILAISYCNAVSVRDQIIHAASRKYESLGLNSILSGRRMNTNDVRGTILGAPSRPSHLPMAEHLLPGNTLIRPVFGMVKSAIKYPHKEQEDGAGVYGNIANLGIPWNGRNERIQYSVTRRKEKRKERDLSTSSEYDDARSDDENDRNAKPDPLLEEFIRAWQESKSGRRSHHSSRHSQNSLSDHIAEITRVYNKLMDTTNKLMNMQKKKKRRAEQLTGL